MTPPSPHLAQEIPGLLLGDLGRERTLRLSGHLRACPECQADLVDAAVAFGSLAASRLTLSGAEAPSGRTGPTDSSRARQPLPPLRTPSANQARKRARVLAAAGAVAAATVLVAAVTTVLDHGRGRSTSHPSELASAPLRPLDAPTGASGEVSLARSGEQVMLDIHTSGLPVPGPNRFYEAWLLNPATNKMMAMGVLPPGGSTSFDVAGNLVLGYSAVDISLQADNGDPAHSTTSVLRATQL